MTNVSARHKRCILSLTMTLIVCYAVEFRGPRSNRADSDNTSVNTITINADEQRTLNILKIKEGDELGSWELFDWKYPTTDNEEKQFICEMTTFKSSSGKEAKMCVHAFEDIISDSIRRDGNWRDCNVLSELWNEQKKKNATDDPLLDYYYVDIGMNIGSCVMEMLLETDAKIIAFEPHPLNLYNLKKTISQLDKSYQDRLLLFPIGLGNVTSTSTIYSASNNMGNSVIGKIIKDGKSLGQKFDAKYQFIIFVERLDSILESNNIHNIRLMKMDAQGFECKILEGMGSNLASKITMVKFEYAGQHLLGQGCTDFLQRMNAYQFSIYTHYRGGGNFTSWIDDGEKTSLGRVGSDLNLDLFAVQAEYGHYHQSVWKLQSSGIVPKV